MPDSATLVPTVSSGTAGPLGAVHLPRLWSKLMLHHAGKLPSDYDSCGAGFDQMTINALGLDRERVIDYVKTKRPTYMQFEQWVVEQNGGSIAPEKIKAHNDAIFGYKHADDLAKKMRGASGCKHDHVKDAVTLNTLEDLDEPALVQILTEPKNALVKQYARLFEMEDVKLTITGDAMKAIARRAIERKTGARGLRSIMEGILLDTMFDLPTLKGVEEVVIGPEVVEGSAKPLRIYSERAEEKGSTAS